MDSESRKKLDVRVKVLIENNVQTNHRSMFVIVGEKSKYQVGFISLLEVATGWAIN